jgi:hypothetical protein
MFKCLSAQGNFCSTMIKKEIAVKDCLGQDVSIGDILMLSFSYTRKGLEPALLIGVESSSRIIGENYLELSLMIKDLDLQKIIEHKLGIAPISNDDVSEAWIESGIKVSNPEFFIHDERISKLLSERLNHIAK